jgi:hypothetical protein
MAAKDVERNSRSLNRMGGEDALYNLCMETHRTHQSLDEKMWLSELPFL